MTGRDWYRVLSPVFGAITKLLTFLPAAFSQFLYNWTSWIPGKLGIAFRVPLAQRLCRSCGSNITIHRSVIILNWEKLAFGDNVQIHPFTYMDALGGITIGNEVSIAHNCSLVSFEHTWADSSLPIKYNPLAPDAISIESDVWLGCAVRLLAGVSIASRSVVAAGSVVTRGNLSSGIYAGIPARFRKEVS